MSDDTEDVVGLTERLQTEADLCRNEGADDIAALLDEAAADRQSLSDRIDVLDHFRADVCNAYESDRDEGEIVEELGKLIRGVRAALHQEATAP